MEEFTSLSGAMLLYYGLKLGVVDANMLVGHSFTHMFFGDVIIESATTFRTTTILDLLLADSPSDRRKRVTEEVFKIATSLSQDLENTTERHKVSLLKAANDETIRKAHIAHEEALAQENYSKDKLREIIIRQRVRFVVHFTPIENLSSILDFGILSRDQLNGRAKVLVDKHRFDGRPSWISTSLSFPNYRMLYQKTMEETVAFWVLLILDPSVLWELQCKFFDSNAASSKSLEVKKEDISNLFFSSDSNHAPYAVDSQTEAMIYKEIPRGYIKGIAVRNENQLQKVEALPNLGSIPVKVRPNLFWTDSWPPNLAG